MNPRGNALLLLVEMTAALVAPIFLTEGCDPQPVRSCRGSACVAESDAGPSDAGSYRGPAASIRIEPATAELIAVDGAGELALHAVVTQLDGTVLEGAAVSWSAGPGSVATIDPTGLLRATGRAGGTVEVIATQLGTGLRATARIEVRVHRSLHVGASVEEAAIFPAGLAPADVASGAEILYPLAGAVMPGNVLAPEIMWRQSEATDVLRITLSRPHARIEAFVRSEARRFVPDGEAWALLARTDPGEPIEIGLDRAHRAGVSGTSPVSVRLARGALPGSAYYWSVGEGTILRIDDHRPDRVDVVPHPPAVSEGGTPAPDGTIGGDGGEQTRCVGCHTISPSGRWMAASMGNGIAPAGARVGAVFDLTRDLASDPAPTTFLTGSYSSSPTWTQASWSPDETRLVIERDMRLSLFDPFAGQLVRPTSGAFVDAISVQPDWAPSGAAIAYVRASSWTVDYGDGDLAIVDVHADGVGTERIVHRGAELSGAPEGGSADSYPTFSPDSRWLAFAHGTTPYAPTGSGALYRVSVDGGPARRLERANAGGDGFAPRFAPFVSGGYAWLAFHSGRDYGNHDRGGDRERTHGIWVTAIRLDAAAGEDPSEVPYWLPGQDPATGNISVSWARRACRVDGESCSDASECCGGECDAGTCAPPVVECRDRGETCSQGTDCCTSLLCFEHVCVDDLG